MVDFLELAKKQRKEVAEEIKEEPKTKTKSKTKPKTKEKEEFKMTVITKPETKPETDESETYEITTTPPADFSMVTKDDIKKHLAMYKYVKKEVVDPSDFYTTNGKEAIKKSGVRKFISAFGLSIEFIEKNVYNLKVNGIDDTHAEVRVRAITPKGQSVEGIGVKSMSELYEKTLHNLIATAWTRAVNRAVLDLVAFGEVSAEEMDMGEDSKKQESTFF